MAKRDSFLLRLPSEVLNALRKWSDDEFRSINAQMEAILVNALRDAGRLPKRESLNQPSASPPESLDSSSNPQSSC